MMNLYGKKPNRLIDEKSPYLLQHAYNPVDWYPWSCEAFRKAKDEDKPIFLSIGYSTCHWCHVMERESFENTETARLMNEVFVSIKVDREERPDIDNIYMLVCQLITGSGGWPLSIVMTPDKKPFFAGTYFPPDSRYGRIGFKDLIINIDLAWKNKRNEINESVEQISDYLRQINSTGSTTSLGTEILDSAFDQYERRYDSIHGGFGRAPKFPSPHNLMFLLRFWKRTGNSKALEMVTHTLTEMSKGGMYDHIGFGFHRYSTDDKWLVPHFEKMLYDQALLAITYTEAYQVTREKEFKRIAEEIIEYVLRDMTSPLGGFYSAEDADSEGMEGKFYVWSKSEFYEILDEDDAGFAVRIFNVNESGNYNDEAAGQQGRANILHLSENRSATAKTFEVTEGEFNTRYERIRSRIFNHRSKRIHPHKDDKILCDWNGLMIAALSIAGRAFSNSKFILAAEKAVGFINQYLQDDATKLLHHFRDGSSAVAANLDDYAFLIWGLLELYRSTFKKAYLADSINLTDSVLKYFTDEKNGGFYFSPEFGEQMLIRTKEIYDGAIPSGNSVMLNNLIRLYRITSNSEYDIFAKQLIDSFSSSISKAPTSSAFLLSSLEYLYSGSAEIIIAGKSFDENAAKIASKLNSYFLPDLTIIFTAREDEEYNPDLEYLGGYHSQDDKPLLYLCRNFACELPTDNAEDILSGLAVKQK